MKIVILGWGSLVWDPRQLPLKTAWKLHGPKLPIEFSRVSRDARLTLVIDPDNGTEVPTRFALSTRTEMPDAIADLRDREGTIRLIRSSFDVEMSCPTSDRLGAFVKDRAERG